jgi:ubiquinone/menaquinone biosynthesis C-methylase UbiE
MADLISAYVPKDGVSRIIDLGCGTGRYSEPLSVHFLADVIGIDPSQKMLEQTRKNTSHRGIIFKQATGEQLPVEEQSIDMVFMSMISHHLASPELTAHECRRILRDGGHVCFRNSTADATESFPYLNFFPGIRQIIKEQLASRNQIRSVFEGAGFDAVAHRAISHQMSPDWSSFANKIAIRSDSFLTRLPDDDFRAGMDALRTYAGHADPGEPVTIDVDFFVFQR